MMSFICSAQWANINLTSHSTPGRQSRKQVQAFLPPSCRKQETDNKWLAPEPLRWTRSAMYFYPWHPCDALCTIVHSTSWTTAICVFCKATLLSAVTLHLRFFWRKKYKIIYFYAHFVVHTYKSCMYDFSLCPANWRIFETAFQSCFIGSK